MFNVADIILIAFLLIVGFIAYKRGFIKTLFGFISFWVAIGLAISFYKPMSVYLRDNTNLDEWIREKISIEYKQDETPNVEVDEKDEEDTVTDSRNIEEVLSGLPSNIKETLGVEELKDNVKSTISDKVVDFSLNTISLIGIYIVVKLVLIIVCFILDSIMKMPVLKQFNEIAGLIFGVITGILQIYMFFAIIMFLSSVLNLEVVTTYIKTSLIANFLYENNLIVSFFF